MSNVGLSIAWKQSAGKARQGKARQGKEGESWGGQSASCGQSDNQAGFCHQLLKLPIEHWMMITIRPIWLIWIKAAAHFQLTSRRLLNKTRSELQEYFHKYLLNCKRWAPVVTRRRKMEPCTLVDSTWSVQCRWWHTASIQLYNVHTSYIEDTR